MEKICSKTSPTSFFDFGKYPKLSNACKRLLKISYFKRDDKKGNLIFFFAPSPFLLTELWKTKRPETSYQSL